MLEQYHPRDTSQSASELHTLVAAPVADLRALPAAGFGARRTDGSVRPAAYPNSSRTFSKKLFDCGLVSSPEISANFSNSSRCFPESCVGVSTTTRTC